MAFRAEYLIRETATNLWRNISLTVAAVLTVAVCLALLGASILVGNGASSLTRQWRGGIEFIVFMRTDAAPEEHAAIRRAIEESPEIRDYKYLDQQDAYEEFQLLFADKPDLIESVTPADLPPSYRVVPADASADAVAGLGAQFEGQPGVREVTYATEALRELESLTDQIQFGLAVAAVILLAVAVLLILNTISTAMASRRREIEVMKLVGASNWFIRIPFMLEGLIHGLIGAGLAVGGVIAVERVIFPQVRRTELLQYFQVTGSQVTTVSILLLVVGAVVGVIGSLWAVSRYLDV